MFNSAEMSMFSSFCLFSDRIVDDMNPENKLTRRQVENLLDFEVSASLIVSIAIYVVVAASLVRVIAYWCNCPRFRPQW